MSPHVLQTQEKVSVDRWASALSAGASPLERLVMVLIAAGVSAGGVTMTEFAELCAAAPGEVFDILAHFERDQTIRLVQRGAGFEAEILNLDPGEG